MEGNQMRRYLLACVLVVISRPVFAQCNPGVADTSHRSWSIEGGMSAIIYWSPLPGCAVTNDGPVYLATDAPAHFDLNPVAWMQSRHCGQAGRLQVDFYSRTEFLQGEIINLGIVPVAVCVPPPPSPPLLPCVQDAFWIQPTINVINGYMAQVGFAVKAGYGFEVYVWSYGQTGPSQFPQSVWQHASQYVTAGGWVIDIPLAPPDEYNGWQVDLACHPLPDVLVNNDPTPEGPALTGEYGVYQRAIAVILGQR
jgi:hypothetical protein